MNNGLEPRSLLVGVNMPVDPRNLSDLEKMHIPEITAPGEVKIDRFFDVQVQVGTTKPHPNDCGHFVMAMELYADDTLLVRADFSPMVAAASSTFRVRLRHPARQLRAVCTCNMHGRWMGASEIAVEA